MIAPPDMTATEVRAALKRIVPADIRTLFIAATSVDAPRGVIYAVLRRNPLPTVEYPAQELKWLGLRIALRRKGQLVVSLEVQSWGAAGYRVAIRDRPQTPYLDAPRHCLEAPADAGALYDWLSMIAAMEET